MDEDEKNKFEEYIVGEVNKIITQQGLHNRAQQDKFNDAVGKRLEETIPNILNKVQPRHAVLTGMLMAILNGASVGVAVYLAMLLGA